MTSRRASPAWLDPLAPNPRWAPCHHPGLTQTVARALLPSHPHFGKGSLLCSSSFMDSCSPLATCVPKSTPGPPPGTWDMLGQCQALRLNKLSSFKDQATNSVSTTNFLSSLGQRATLPLTHIFEGSFRPIVGAPIPAAAGLNSSCAFSLSCAWRSDRSTRWKGGPRAPQVAGLWRRGPVPHMLPPHTVWHCGPRANRCSEWSCPLWFHVSHPHATAS